MITNIINGLYCWGTQDPVEVAELGYQLKLSQRPIWFHETGALESELEAWTYSCSFVA